MAFTGSPKLLKGGLALLDPRTFAVLRVVALQYNPESVTRTLQPSASGAEQSGDRLEALRLKGPPVETIKLDAEFDATDALEKADTTTATNGLLPLLSALETIVYPTSTSVTDNFQRAGEGVLEVAPVLAPQAVFVFGPNRSVPVRVTDMTITEEAFDPILNPIRAKVSLTLRVLSALDLGLDTRGGGLFQIYHLNKERQAGLAASHGLSDLGVGGF
jgi:hypothetical protein